MNRRGRCLLMGAPAMFVFLGLSFTACQGEEVGSGKAAARAGAKAVDARPVSAGGAPSGFEFVDVAASAGVGRVLLAGRPGKDHLLDSAGTGAAWLDYDGDGHMDIYLVNGWLLDGRQVMEKGKNALYRNRGDGTFADVTEAAGVEGEGQWGSGVAVADYDGDGLPDILVTNFGANVLYRNLGKGRFEDVAEVAGIQVPGWNTGAAFLDADLDGDPDLYIAAYIDHGLKDVLEARLTLNWKGMDKVAVGPFGLDGAVDHFFLNNGDGTFHDATTQAGLDDRGMAYGFAVRAVDYDRDGDPDLYVANDSDPNYLYRNDGTGRFQEVGVWSGAALDGGGAAQAGMGVAVGDADGDGNPDIFVTNFAEDFSTLYLGEGRGFFRDATVEAGLGEPTFPDLSWGTALVDLDNDGDQDLVIANGHIYPQVDDHPLAGTSYAQRNRLMENLGDGRFVEAGLDPADGFNLMRNSHGLAAADYDNDGDLDLLFTNLDEPPTLLRNQSATGNWLMVQVIQPKGTATTLGTLVTVEAGGRTQWRDITSGGSYMSTHDPRLHFGLGDARTIDQVHIAWPDGSETIIRDVACCQVLKVDRPSTSDR
jgi:hypothetical protein